MEKDFIPDFTDTPLKKIRNFKALVVSRQREDSIIKEHEGKKKEFTDQIFDILVKADVDRARVDNFTVNLSTSERTSLDPGELRVALLDLGLKGLTLEVIEACFKQATKTSKTSYVTIRETK